MMLPRNTVRLAALAAGVLLASSAHAQWGTVKGKVAWAGGAVPKNEKANVDKDKKECLAKGCDVRVDKVVVNPKNKGVQWVLVWLADPKDARDVKFAPKIHPKLQNPPKSVVIDQPCCTFGPRVMGLQVKKQNLVVKNSMPISHNFAITSFGGGPNKNPLILPGQEAKIEGFVPNAIPTPYSCSIHPWMKGYIGTFAHPYFAITDEDGNFEIKNAPAGKFQLVLWQEEAGFLTRKDAKMRGNVIEIKADKTTDVGAVDMKIAKD
jgi:hypothetical protein